MTAKVHRLLKVIAFNANGIWRQRFELNKQLQDLCIDVAVLSETNPMSFFIPNYHFYQTDCFPGRKGRTESSEIMCKRLKIHRATQMEENDN
jgi:hypothetical protein